MKQFSIPITNSWVGEAASNRLQTVGYEFPGYASFPSGGYLNAHSEGLISFSDAPLFKLIDTDVFYEKSDSWFKEKVSFTQLVLSTVAIIVLIDVWLFFKT